MNRSCAYLFALLLSVSGVTTNAFDAHEWLIVVNDPEMAEPRVHLPRFIKTRKSRKIGDGPPPPHGGILLEGAPPKVLDVVLKLPSDTKISASWPQAKYRKGQLTWTALTPATTPLRTANSWWQNLRSDSPGVGRDGQYDSVLFFDPDMKLGDMFTLKVTDKTLRVTQRGETTADTAIIALSRAEDLWATAAAKPAEDATPKDPKTLRESLEPVIKNAPEKIQLHLTEVIKHALTGAEHAAIVVLSEKTINAEILPLPDTHTKTRLGLLVWRKSRTEANWQALVKQLGHADWAMRETASTELAEMGEAALPALTKALKSKNLEIRLRSERLIMRLGKDPDKLSKPADKKTTTSDKKPTRNAANIQLMIE